MEGYMNNLLSANISNATAWGTILVVVLVIFLVIFFAIIAKFFKTWLRARLAKAPVSMSNMLGMWLRKVPYPLVVDTRITAAKAGLDISTDELEAHFLAGGDIVDCVLALIAAEKAGIIKKGVPVLLGEAEKRSVFDLFQNEARKAGAPFHYALSMGMLEGTGGLSMVHWKFPSVEYGEVIGELAGEVQQANAITVFSALHLLREKCGVDILPEAVHEGFGHVTQPTGLMGRWQTLRTFI